MPTLASVVAVSLVSLVGVALLSLDERRLRALATVLVSFAVGALLGDAFIHLLPEAFRRDEEGLRPSLLVLGGMLLFFAVEKLLRHAHGPLHRRAHADVARPELAAINVVGDAVHNFIDGVLVAASWLSGPTLGVSTTVAVLLHELPAELGDFGVLLHSGLPRRKAVLLNLGSASTSVLGAVLTLAVGSGAAAAVTGALVPVAAGGFVYIAAADLVPELQHDHSLRALLVQGALMSAGIAVMALLVLLE